MTEDPIDYGTLERGRDCNYWNLDRTLQFAVQRSYPDTEWDWAAARLEEWGEILGKTIAENAAIIDRNGPELHTYDRNGNVRNHVEYHPLQEENERLAYQHGIVADSFQSPPGRDEPLGLLHHLTMTGMLGFVDPGFACPVAMTGGAALVLQKFDDGALEEYYDGLTSRSYEDVIEGAMFLTETQGGSDVGATETVATATGETKNGVPVYELSGEKWFCSNLDAEGTLALARRPDAPGGTDGLSLFLVPHTDRDGELNDQLYRRLKDKLGTLSVPTGEVEFHGAEGYLIGEAEAGFEYMTEMLNLERLHNAFGAVGNMGRCLLECKVHAARREAFGETIDQHPLLRRDLVEMGVEYEAATAFAFTAARQFDRREAADPETAEHREAFQLMRTLIPVAKYKTARLSVETASYACEVLGGNGYVTGFTTERLLRDAQVLPIWEGTSNILSLDLLRALDREDAHAALIPYVSEKLAAVENRESDSDGLGPLVETVRGAHRDLQSAMGYLATADAEYAQHEAKRLADLVFDVVTATVLLEDAAYARDEQTDGRKQLVAGVFVRDRFESPAARGITTESAIPDEYYDAIVRYGPVDPSDATAALAGD